MRVLAFLLIAPLLAGCVASEPELDLPVEGQAPEFAGITDWIGSQPLTIAELAAQDKVVLIDFWTYSCENCIRTLPHLTAWHAAYADHGLVIVGVHAPEFEFEKERDNVVDAMERYGIHYPVAQDNEMSTWRAWENRYWPAKFLIDTNGDVRYHRFGEGDYAGTENAIRQLLRDAGAIDLPARVEGDGGTGIRRDDITPELYAGHWRQDWTIGNPEGYVPGEVVNYSSDGTDLLRDRIYLDGAWENRYETMHAEGPGTAYLKFRSGPVNFVGDGPIGSCVEVLLDGAPITASHAAEDVTVGADRSCVILDGPRAYHVYDGPVGTHKLALVAPDGFDLYTFVFSSYDNGGPA